MLRRILSRDSGAFWQFVKYAAVGAFSTVVQAATFYALASTVCKCLAPGDWAVELAGLPAVEIGDAERSVRFAIASAGAFTVANIACWLLNRAFVFTPGKYRWWKEFGIFYAASAVALGLSTGLSVALIHARGMMTTLAAAIQAATSFLINYATRRFVIFKG